MASLTASMQRDVVQLLAEYRTPMQVVKAVKEKHGVELDREQVHYYDPTTGRKPAQKWQDLFWKTREAIQENVADRGILHVGYRMAEYQRMYHEAVRMRNYALAMDIMKQAAEDLGGKFTNEQKHEHSGPDGGPVQTVSANMDLSAFEETDDPEELMKLFNTTFGA